MRLIIRPGLSQSFVLLKEKAVILQDKKIGHGIRSDRCGTRGIDKFFGGTYG